jgi:hypothetical protein
MVLILFIRPFSVLSSPIIPRCSKSLPEQEEYKVSDKVKSRALRPAVNYAVRNLLFFNSNGAGRANLNARFAAQTFIGIDGRGFIPLKLIDAYRANIHAFAVTITFVLVNSNFITHFNPPKILGGIPARL